MRSSVIYFAAFLGGQTMAHTWVEQMSVIEKGNFVGDYGYPRGYVARTDPGFTGDSNNYLLPPLQSGRTKVDDTDLLCHASQRTAKQSAAYPRLKATPGSYLAMRYTENGHVTLPDVQKGKPEMGGTVFVFGTDRPSDNEKITDVLKWTADGQGGDRRGRLLSAQNFDDGRCYQINDSGNSQDRQAGLTKAYPKANAAAEQWCETDVKLPEDVKTGKPLAVYWVWQWPTLPGQDPGLPDGKDEYYTTCADVDVIDGVEDRKFKAKAEGKDRKKHTLVQQDGQTAAVSDYRSRKAVETNPLGPNEAEPTGPPSAPAPSVTLTTFTTPAASQPTPSYTTYVITLVETLTIPLPQATEVSGDKNQGQGRDEGKKRDNFKYGSAKFRM